MGDDNRAIIDQMRAAMDSVRAPELDSLIAALHGGVQIMPSDMVQRTTIFVTPATWDALHERIARDTETARRDRQP